MTPNYRRIPFEFRDEVRSWIERGIMPGTFIQAVLLNDLNSACACIPSAHRTGLPDIVGFFRDEAPGGCWGDSNLIKIWHEAGGLYRDPAVAVPSSR